MPTVWVPVAITNRPDSKGIVLVATLLRGEFATQMHETKVTLFCSFFEPDFIGIEAS